MALRLAKESTTRIDLGDDAWVEVREDISKRSMNRLMVRMPRRSQDEVKETGLTLDEGLEFQIGLFESLVTAWSLDIVPNAEGYLSLDSEDATALDEKLAAHFEALMPTKDEQGKP